MSNDFHGRQHITFTCGLFRQRWGPDLSTDLGNFFSPKKKRQRCRIVCISPIEGSVLLRVKMLSVRRRVDFFRIKKERETWVIEWSFSQRVTRVHTKSHELDTLDESRHSAVVCAGCRAAPVDGATSARVDRIMSDGFKCLLPAFIDCRNGDLYGNGAHLPPRSSLVIGALTKIRQRAK